MNTKAFVKIRRLSLIWLFAFNFLNFGRTKIINLTKAVKIESDEIF